MAPSYVVMKFNRRLGNRRAVARRSACPPCPPLPPFEPGTVWLVGAGPGRSRASDAPCLERSRQADAIVYDALVDPPSSSFAREGALREFAGKRGGKPRSRRRTSASG